MIAGPKAQIRLVGTGTDMVRAVMVVVVACASMNVWGSQERPPIDRAKLEWFKKLSPEQKRLLRERVERLRKLSPEERERLMENLRRWRAMPEEARRRLRERVEGLPSKERVVYGELAQLYARQIRRVVPKNFPREMFFGWLRKERAVDFGRIRDLTPEARASHFETLHAQFREHILERAEHHLEVHPACFSPERLEQARTASPEEFWAEYHKLMQEVKSKHQPPRRPGTGERPPFPKK